MTSQRPAYEQVTFVHGGNTVTLRPSLRAAVTLEEKFGFPALYRALAEQNFTIISDIIRTAKSGAQYVAPFPEQSLFLFFAETLIPVANLLDMFRPETDSDAKPTSGKSISWSQAHRELFNAATGWLGWTPQAAWEATPNEIASAYSAHIARLKAIHGSADDQSSNSHQAPHDLAQRLSSDGIDPEFDRERFQALKASIARAKR
ncbi:hypothetical protein SAMN05877838_0213 [Hoeflea halophila]|uniref:Tail assembly chaperone n=1 Tax=Hoeflea halophila TaxID=714899 RepID=A0A286HL51_9HYPH|nr:hypothetical protein [Hoeflea halophila]SOE08491.1 hypothetical protein SAMN05877838_0213 [Hoeflea halophila]